MGLRVQTSLVLVLSLFILLVQGHADSRKSALVIQTKTSKFFDRKGNKKTLKTCQILQRGQTLEVPKGAFLRISYFKSGIKERIEGPCTVTVGREMSLKQSDTGSITVGKRRSATPTLDESKNLRRMGGGRQAQLEHHSEKIIARLGDEYVSLPITGGGNAAYSATPPQAPEPRALKLEGSGAYLKPEEALTQAWSGALPQGVFFLTGSPKDLPLIGSSQKRRITIPAGHLREGVTYTLSLQSGEFQTSRRFRIYSSVERQEYQARLSSIAREESKDKRAYFARKLVMEAELGLLFEARNTARSAHQAFPKDSGLLLTLAQLAEALGNKKEAEKLVRERGDMNE